MMTQFFNTNLEYRIIQRGEDKDYFIETLAYPINLEFKVPHFSRLQFPKSRAILVRTSPSSTYITVHIMRDVDLHSSFINFEVNLKNSHLKIMQQDGYIEVTLVGDYSEQK